jgi:hypothetical protein
MATPEYFYAAKFGNIRGLQSFLTRGELEPGCSGGDHHCIVSSAWCSADPCLSLGVDVDAKAVVGGYNACAPHYSHANEILEGDTALHVAIRNRKKEVC